MDNGERDQKRMCPNPAPTTLGIHERLLRSSGKNLSRFSLPSGLIDEILRFFFCLAEGWGSRTEFENGKACDWDRISSEESKRARGIPLNND